MQQNDYCHHKKLIRSCSLSTTIVCMIRHRNAIIVIHNYIYIYIYSASMYMYNMLLKNTWSMIVRCLKRCEQMYTILYMYVWNEYFKIQVHFNLDKQLVIFLGMFRLLVLPKKLIAFGELTIWNCSNLSNLRIYILLGYTTLHNITWLIYSAKRPFTKHNTSIITYF